MALFLIGFGVGTLMAAGIKQVENSDRDWIPARYLWVAGCLTVAAGIAKLVY